MIAHKNYLCFIRQNVAFIKVKIVFINFNMLEVHAISTILRWFAKKNWKGCDNNILREWTGITYDKI